MSQAPFNIPAINNRIEVLAKYLEINSDDPIAMSTIQFIKSVSKVGTAGGEVHYYKHQSDTYIVTGNNKGINADAVIAFNSNLWSILKINKKAPNFIYRDNIVIEALADKELLSVNYKIIAINQVEQLVLFESINNDRIIVEYSSKERADISSYDFKNAKLFNVDYMKKVFNI